MPFTFDDSATDALHLTPGVRRKLAEAPVFLDRHHRGRHLSDTKWEGRFIRVARGVYTTPAETGLTTWALRERSAFVAVKAALATAPPGTVIGYEYAAMLYGTPVRRLPSEVAVISSRRTSTTNRPLGRRRHVRNLAETDVAVLGGMPVTAPLRTAVDCARSCDIVEAFVIVDYLLRRIAQPDVYDREGSQARIDRARRDMLAILDSEVGYRGNPQARLVIQAASGWAQSRLESEASRMCRALGMPPFIGQYYVWTAKGESFTDLGWEFEHDGNLTVSHLEIDGDIKYEDVTAIRKERNREAEIRALGHPLTRADTGHLGPRDLLVFQRRLAQIVPRSVQLTLRPDHRYMTPWERANLVVSWLDPTLPHAHR